MSRFAWPCTTSQRPWNPSFGNRRRRNEVRDDFIPLLAYDYRRNPFYYRGLMALEILSAIESMCPGYRIHQLFDYVVGVSTGAIIEALVAGLQLPIHECKQIYHDIASRLFAQSRVRGSFGLLWSHSYYDTTAWVRFLRQAMGEKRMMDTSHTPECPRVSSAFPFLTGLSNRTLLLARHYLVRCQSADDRGIRSSKLSPPCRCGIVLSRLVQVQDMGSVASEFGCAWLLRGMSIGRLCSSGTFLTLICRSYLLIYGFISGRRRISQ